MLVIIITTYLITSFVLISLWVSKVHPNSAYRHLVTSYIIKSTINMSHTYKANILDNRKLCTGCGKLLNIVITTIMK